MATQPAICPYCTAPTFGMRFCTNCGASLHTAAAQPICPHCGAPSPGMQFCTNCGMGLTTPPSQAPPTPTAEATPAPVKKEVRVSRKYGALRAVVFVYRIIGWVLLVGGSLLSAAAGIAMTVATGSVEQNLPQLSIAETEAVVVAIGGVILSVLSGLLALAFADVCSVLMDIEANTRVQAESRPGQAPPPQ